MYKKSRSTRRVFTAALLASALLGSATACSSSSSSASLDPKATTTIQVWSGQADAAESILVKLGSEFHAQHPNVTVQITPGAPNADYLLQKLSAGFAGNQYPDVSYAYGRWGSQLEASGRTLDLRSEVKKSSVRWSEFTAAARQTAQPTGKKVIGFPALIDNIGVIYNKTLFDRAHIAYPTDDWTWDDFRTAAKKLTDPSRQVYGYGTTVSGTGSTAFQYWPLLWQNGGSILTADAKKTAFDSTAGAAALNTLRTMAVDDKSVYLDQTNNKYLPLFISNRIAMVTSGPWNLSDLKAGGTDYGVTYLPGVGGDHETVSGPDLWAVFDHQDANRAHWATRFTEWLTQPAQDAKFNVGLGNLPLRSSELESAAVKAQAAKFPGYDVFVANSGNVKKAMPTVDGFANVADILGKSISASLQGQGDAKSALSGAASAADAALAK